MTAVARWKRSRMGGPYVGANLVFALPSLAAGAGRTRGSPPTRTDRSKGANLVFTLVCRGLMEGEHKVRPYNTCPHPIARRQAESWPRWLASCVVINPIIMWPRDGNHFCS